MFKSQEHLERKWIILPVPTNQKHDNELIKCVSLFISLLKAKEMPLNEVSNNASVHVVSSSNMHKMSSSFLCSQIKRTNDAHSKLMMLQMSFRHFFLKVRIVTTISARQSLTLKTNHKSDFMIKILLTVA